MNINEYNQTLENNYTTIRKIEIKSIYESLKSRYIENKLSVRHLKPCLYPDSYYEYFNLLENKYKINNCNDIENILTIFYYHLKNNVNIVTINNNDLKYLNLLFLTKKLNYEIFYISRFKVNFIVLSLLNQDNKDNILIFKNNQDKNKILDIIEKKEKKEKKDLIKSCNDIKKFNDINQVKTYQDLYNLKVKNPYKKECIKNFWNIRKNNKLNTKENKNIIKKSKKKYSNKFLINEIIECLLLNYTNKDIINNYINYFNIENIINDLFYFINSIENDIININKKIDIIINNNINYENNIFMNDRFLNMLNSYNIHIFLDIDDLKILENKKDNYKYLLSLLNSLYFDLKENKQLILEKKEKIKDIEIIENDYY